MADESVVVSNSSASSNPDYTVAVDTVAGKEYQIVKLDIGADGATKRIVSGQAAMADSVPVVLASDQSAIPVTASLSAGTNNIGDVDVLSVPAPLSTTGGGTEAAALRVTIASDSTGVVSVDDNGATISIDDGGGAITVDGTVAVSGTVTVDLGANNDIQGQAAHDAAAANNPLTAGLRASLATPTSVSADGDVVWQWGDRAGRAVVKSVAPTATLSSVAGSASSVTILAANTSRLGATVYNDSSAILYLKLGATASTSSFTTKIFPDGYYEVPAGYSGILDGIWASATGNARVTELT